MKNNMINTEETVHHEELVKRIRRTKKVVDIFVSAFLLLLVVVGLGVLYCGEAGIQFPMEKIADIAIGLFVHTLILSIIGLAIASDIISGCFKQSFICKECGHVHAISSTELSKTCYGYALCPKCQDLTKHKKLSRNECPAHSAQEEAV